MTCAIFATARVENVVPRESKHYCINQPLLSQQQRLTRQLPLPPCGQTPSTRSAQPSAAGSASVILPLSSSSSRKFAPQPAFHRARATSAEAAAARSGLFLRSLPIITRKDNFRIYIHILYWVCRSPCWTSVFWESSGFFFWKFCDLFFARAWLQFTLGILPKFMNSTHVCGKWFNFKIKAYCLRVSVCAVQPAWGRAGSADRQRGLRPGIRERPVKGKLRLTCAILYNTDAKGFLLMF